MLVVLAVQALLFQDGGVAAFGANLIDMGIAAVLAAHTIAATVARRWPTPRAVVAGSVLGAFGATLVAATLTGLWLGVSGLYPLRAILPLLLLTHVAIGLLEAAITGAALATVIRWRPDLIGGLAPDRRLAHPGAVAAGLLGVALALAAFASPFASSLPDGLEHVAETLGFADRASAAGAAPFPDYTVPFVGSAGLTAAVAGLAGTVAAAVLAWAISRGLGTPRHDPHA